MMRNEIWEKVRQFLKQLRGEQKTRNSSIQIQDIQSIEKDKEVLWENLKKYFNDIPEAEKSKAEEWINKVEELSYLQEQRAYSQGYVDCILLLSGLGLLKQEIPLESFMDVLNQ